MEFLPYILDIVVVAFLLVMAVRAYRKGFLGTVLHFLPMVAAVFAVRFLTPFVGGFLRKTPLYTILVKSIAGGTQPEQMAGAEAVASQTELIQNMPLPEFLKDSLLENNNPVAYELLRVDDIQAYIAGFLANICVNIISVFLVFAAAYLTAKFLLAAMNLVCKMPGLHFFNRSCGFLLGAVKGLCVVWLCCFVLTFFQCSLGMYPFFDALEKTNVVSVLYENNILLYFILTIFA